MIKYSDNGLIIQPLTEILAERENVCKDLFGDDFYIECAPSTNSEQLIVNKKLYNIDCDNLNNYTFVIDNSNLTPEQTADEIYKAYLQFINK